MSEIFFLPGKTGSLLAVHWPGDTAKTPVLLLPPLLEELNKSRRQMNQTALTLSRSGHGVLLVDWCGTGDSAGDLADVGWSHWQQDVQTARDFLHQHYAKTPVLCAIRGGALLLPEHPDCSWLLCAPIVSGAQQVTQWLRLKLMAARMAGEALTSEQLQAQIAGGGVEIAGYFLAPSLVSPLQAINVVPPTDPAHCLRVFEFGAGKQPAPALRPLLADRPDRWQAITGDAFWQTSEITLCPALDQAIANTVSQWERPL